ncbi:hypothetical protein J7K86_00810 [bacterium]|nr:hypothetical protein [bacterium]
MAEENKIDHGKLLSEWNFPEYQKYERSKNYYIGLTIAFLVFFIYAIFTRNYIFAVILVLLILIIFLNNKREPIKIPFKIFEDGIMVGKNFYEWDQINSFRIVYNPPQIKRLYIDLKGTLLRDFSVSLEDKDPLEVRKILKQYLVEDLTKPYETLTDRMNRWLKI